jgi:hypothetical protein
MMLRLVSLTLTTGAPKARVRHEGLRQGMYVRVALRGVPAEFCSGFRADSPVVLGGLQPHESTMGIIHVSTRFGCVALTGAIAASDS